MRTSALRKSSGLAAVGTLWATAALAQQAVPQAGSVWYTDAQARIEEMLARQPNTNRARNVILMVADGKGVGTNYAIRLFDGQRKGLLGEENVLSYEAFPNLALVKTYNTNAQTPDSAATASSMNTGVKSKSGSLNVSENATTGDCSATAGNELKTFAEMVSETGKSVGVVSTARITHATPAAVYAKAADRHWEDDSALPEGCTQTDIAAQLIGQMKAGVVDVAMGGGRRHFLPADAVDEDGNAGTRSDGRNLIEEARALGARYVHDDATASRLTFGDTAPILGLFESSHMKYEHDRAGEPSLAEMTETAIKALQGNENGFYLAVEAGRVDHANHDGNLYRALTDGVAFAEAVAVADELTDDDDTLIVVTADHEHAIAFNGYCGRGSPINGLCYGIDPAGEKHTDEVRTGDDGKPYTVAGYLNGPGAVLVAQGDGSYAGSRPELTPQAASDPDYVLQAVIPRSSETHSGEDVAVYAKGPWAHLFDGTIEQNYIFHVMHHAVSAE